MSTGYSPEEAKHIFERIRAEKEAKKKEQEQEEE